MQPRDRARASALLKSKFSSAASNLSTLAASSSSSAVSSARKGLRAWQDRRAGSRDGHEGEEGEEGDGMGGEYDPERLEEVMERVICQAGVDYETRPMIVITAAALPDPHEISYDLLLACVLSTLDLYVESDYTVVFLAAGGRHTPGWNWVWKAYRSLSRKYRKNLKKLYIVHSTLFSKMLVSLAGAIISPKFFRKIQYVSTLSALARLVPITQINVAPEVYKANLNYEKTITLPDMTHAAVFGVPLEKLGGGIPQVLKDCGQYILTDGLVVEGLFRRSPSSALLRQAQEAYDRGHPVTLSSFHDPHIAAVLLKKFFHDLPEPLVPEAMYAVVRRCPGEGEEGVVRYVRERILGGLGAEKVRVLGYALQLMHDVSLHSHINKMDASNLALCFAPNLVSSRNPMLDVQMCMLPSSSTPSSFPVPTSPPTTPTLRSPGGSRGQTTLAQVLKLCIERYFEIFDDDPPSPPARPLSASLPSLPSLSLSSTPTPTSTSAPTTRPDASDQEDDGDGDETVLVMSVESPTVGSGGGGRKFTQQGHRRTDTQDSEVSLGSLLSESDTHGGGGGYASKTLPAVPVGQRSMFAAAAGEGEGTGTGRVGRGGEGGRRRSGSGVEVGRVSAGGVFSGSGSAPGSPGTPRAG